MGNTRRKGGDKVKGVRGYPQRTSVVYGGRDVRNRIPDEDPFRLGSVVHYYLRSFCFTMIPFPHLLLPTIVKSVPSVPSRETLRFTSLIPLSTYRPPFPQNLSPSSSMFPGLHLWGPPRPTITVGGSVRHLLRTSLRHG